MLFCFISSHVYESVDRKWFSSIVEYRWPSELRKATACLLDGYETTDNSRHREKKRKKQEKWGWVGKQQQFDVVKHSGANHSLDLGEAMHERFLSLKRAILPEMNEYSQDDDDEGYHRVIVKRRQNDGKMSRYITRRERKQICQYYCTAGGTGS